MAQRRQWDKAFYEQKAKERLEKGDEEEETLEAKRRRAMKEEFMPAEPGAAGPEGSERAFVKARSSKIDLDSKVGKTQVITQHTSEAEAGGYWCEVCLCLLKDSMSYLDHINGKRHQRRLGFSMRVERADAEAVRQRLAELRRRAEGDTGSVIASTDNSSALQEYEERLAREAAESAAREKAKKQQRKEAKEKERQAQELEEMDPEIAAIMGFGGFKTNKN